jgi:hypothetical protein
MLDLKLSRQVKSVKSSRAIKVPECDCDPAFRKLTAFFVGVDADINPEDE